MGNCKICKKNYKSICIRQYKKTGELVTVNENTKCPYVTFKINQNLLALVRLCKQDKSQATLITGKTIPIMYTVFTGGANAV